MKTESSDSTHSDSRAAGLSRTKKVIFTFAPLIIVLILVELIVAAYSYVTQESGENSKQPWPVVNVAALDTYFAEKTLKTTYNARMYAEYFAFDATLGVRFRPSVWSFSLEPDAQGNPTIAQDRRLAINQYGFVSNTSTLIEAVDYASIVEADDVLRIYISGGSTSVGWGASDNEHTWPALLERMIQQKLDTGGNTRFKRVHVFNGAVFGYGVSQEIKRFMEEGIYLKPHVVLMFNGINERWGYQGNPVDYTLRKEQHRLMNPPNIGEAFTPKIFFPYIREALYKAQGNELRDPLVYYAYKQPGFVTADVQTYYFSKVEQFKALCDHQGIEFRHALQPVMGIGKKQLAPSEELVKAYMGGGFYPPWEPYLRRAQLFYAGAQPNVAEPWQQDMTGIFDHVTEAVYLDPRHYNDFGNRMIAAEMFKTVQTLGLL